MRVARVRRSLGLLGVVALLIGVAQLSVQAASRWPGDEELPPFPGTLAAPDNVAAAGLGRAEFSGQWFLLPRATMTVPTWVDGDQVRAEVYVNSPPGAEHRYGHLPAVTVRTLALGLAPATVRVEIEQLRRTVHADDGSVHHVPEPWVLTGPFTPGGHHLRGRVLVRVTDMRLDGRRVRLGRDCRTAFAAWLDLTGDSSYSVTGGGRLDGTIDIPRFVDCGADGEDLDGMLTSFVSGAGQRLSVGQASVLTGQGLPEFTLPD